jgi:hypothetical protein
MIREDTTSFGLGALSIYVENNGRLAYTLTTSLKDSSARHGNVAMNLLTEQMAHIKGLVLAINNTREGTILHIKRQLNYCMRARQLLSVHSSKLHLRKKVIAFSLTTYNQITLPL